MGPAFRLDAGSPVPPYEQVRGQVVDLVAAGALRPGDRLPAVRRLAEDLGLAPGTVARAYKELEAAGVVVTAGRAGTVVAPTGDRTRRHAQEATLAYLRELDRLGLGPDDVPALLDEVGGGS